jgi:radical SAM protein with 4Fe4S-binding SPASM domain
MFTCADPGFVDLMNPAGIGIAAVVFNYDGSVYASDESRMLAEMKDQTFRLGSVLENTYEEIFLNEKLLSTLEESFTLSAPMCSECAFEPFCGADPVFSHAVYGDVVGRKPASDFCKRNMAIFRHLIQLMRCVFRSFVTGQSSST